MSSLTRPQVLIIGIDGADYLITQRLIEEGRLPALQALVERGAWGPIQSTTPPVTPPAWTSLMTGQNPGKHGIFDFLPMSGEAFDTPIAVRRRSMTVWRALSDRSFRVGTFNLPVTYPPEPLSGFQVSGFDAPSFQPGIAYPPSAFSVLENAVGAYDLFPLSIQAPDGDPEALRRHADLPLSATRGLLQEFPCDIYMVSFQIVDWIQHGALGREMRARDTVSLALDGVVVRTYELVDEAVAALLDEWATHETTIIVISDHGGTSADRLVNLEKLFLDQGLMTYMSASSDDTSQLMARRSRAERALKLWMTLKDRAPWAAGMLRSLARRLRGRFAEYQRDVKIDWTRTRAAPWGKYAEIRFNIAGRDPEGVVLRSEVEALTSEVIELLLSLTDPCTGESIYREVLTNSELYHGPFASLGPDLYGLPASDRYLTVSARSGMGSLPLIDVQPEPVVSLDPPWGVHSPTGIVLLVGPGVQPGAQIAQANLTDFVPTLLYLLDEPIPEDLDGRPLLEAMRPTISAARPVKTCAPWPLPEVVGGRGYSEQERADIEAKLRALGYL